MTFKAKNFLHKSS